MFTIVYDWMFFSSNISIWFLILTCSLQTQVIGDSLLFDESQQLSAGRRVVVFDIDGTLCNSLERPSMFYSEKDVKCARDYHPECPIIICKNNTMDLEFTHIFLPYLQVLFGYLIEQGTRIAFFSAGIKDRNEELIPALFTYFWGSEKYKALRAKGQFNVHSKDDMRESEHKYSEEGNNIKDLKAVIRGGELLSNVILVDDDRFYTAQDQQPFVCVPDLTIQWYTCESYCDCYKNIVFYILGLFKTYFEHEKYNELYLREAFRLILPKKSNYYSYIKENEPFKLNMAHVGLSEVQKQIPHARFYNSSRNPELFDEGW